MALEETKPRIFAREASGLVKAVGTGGAILFGVHCISLSSSGFIPFSWVPSVWPGANIVWLLIVAMLIALVHGYVFASIGAAMPRSGADYVLASRLLNPTVSFVASWTLVISSAIVAGGLIAWIPKSAAPALLQPMAILFNDPRYSVWADYSSSTTGSILIGTAFVFVTLGLMTLHTRHILRILSLGLILGLLAWAIILWSLMTAPGPQAFVDAWNHFVGPTGPFGAFDKRIDLARAAGMTLSNSPLTMTAAGLIMGFWIFYGYAIPTFFAGEIRATKSNRTLLISSASAIGITGLIFIVAALLLQRLVPDAEWIAAEGYLSNNADAVAKVAGQPVQALPWITFYAAILNPNPFNIVFIAFAWVYTLVNLAQTYFFYTSRIIFSWAFDRVVPEVFTYVHPKTRSPIVCLLFIAGLAELGVVDAAYGGPLGTQLVFAFVAVVTQIPSVIALIRFPRRAPEQFRLCPSFVRATWERAPLVVLFGYATLAYFGWMIFASFYFPAAGLSSPLRTLLILFVIASLGLLSFQVARWHRRKYEGFDIAQIYRMVPPA